VLDLETGLPQGPAVAIETITPNVVSRILALYSLTKAMETLHNDLRAKTVWHSYTPFFGDYKLTLNLTAGQMALAKLHKEQGTKIVDGILATENAGSYLAGKYIYTYMVKIANETEEKKENTELEKLNKIRKTEFLERIAKRVRVDPENEDNKKEYLPLKSVALKLQTNAQKYCKSEDLEQKTLKALFPELKKLIHGAEKHAAFHNSSLFKESDINPESVFGKDPAAATTDMISIFMADSVRMIYNITKREIDQFVKDTEDKATSKSGTTPKEGEKPQGSEGSENAQPAK